MSQKKGNFVIKNNVGLVVLAGVAAAAFLNSNNSTSVTDDSPIDMHKDSAGIPATLTKDYQSRTMELDLTPGIGGQSTAGVPGVFASKAALQAAFVLPVRGNLFSSSGFDHADMNWPVTNFGIIWEASIQNSSDGLSTMRVTVKYFVKNDGVTFIDFSGAWADI
jgi:hypothetical protein